MERVCAKHVARISSKTATGKDENKTIEHMFYVIVHAQEICENLQESTTTFISRK